MDITFNEYIRNPMAKNNMVFSNRHIYANLYKDKLDKILTREVGKIKYQLYTDEKSGDYYCYLLIPSEVVEKFYYDVVIRFYTNDPKVSNSSVLTNYKVQFFSNDPSFVFTFAHAMHKNKLFIEDLKPVMSKEALKKLASQRNPKDEIGYVKSIYFAYLIMIRYGLFDKAQYKTYAKKYNPKELIKQIVPADLKIQQRQELQPRKNINNKKVESGFTRDHLTINTKGNIVATKSSNVITKSKKSKVVNRVKRSNKVKKI